MIATATHRDLPKIRFAEGEPSTTTSHEPLVNLAEWERWASSVSGATIALYGLTRGTLGGLFLVGVGGALIKRGITGHCDLYQKFGINDAR